MVAANSDSPLFTALDIGSSKVSAMIVARDPDGRLRVLGTGQRESRGVKRGYITDMEASEVAVREAVELAERMSGVTVDDVWASFGAKSLISDLANVEVELGGHQVEQSDIDQLLITGRNAINRPGQVVLHAHPALFTIDDTQGVKQPIGLFAKKLGVDIHVVAADAAPLKNIDYVIRSAHLGVKAIVASPLAAAIACLTEEERDIGVANVRSLSRLRGRPVVRLCCSHQAGHARQERRADQPRAYLEGQVHLGHLWMGSTFMTALE